MIILGIDPGFAITGYGLIAVKGRVMSHVADGVIRTKEGDLHYKRLLQVAKALQAVIKRYKPHFAVIEELFVYKNVKTAMKVGEARGVILLTLARMHVPIFELSPLQIKQSLTGYGRATKTQMQKMVQRVLRLDTPPQPDDAADALAAAICFNQTPYLISPLYEGRETTI